MGGEKQAEWYSISIVTIYIGLSIGG